MHILTMQQGVACCAILTILTPRTEIKLRSMRLEKMETHLNIVHDHVLVPRPAQSAAIMAQLEEASLLWGF